LASMAHWTGSSTMRMGRFPASHVYSGKAVLSTVPATPKRQLSLERVPVNPLTNAVFQSTRRHLSTERNPVPAGSSSTTPARRRGMSIDAGAVPAAPMSTAVGWQYVNSDKRPRPTQTSSAKVRSSSLQAGGIEKLQTLVPGNSQLDDPPLLFGSPSGRQSLKTRQTPTSIISDVKREREWSLRESSRKSRRSPDLVGSIRSVVDCENVQGPGLRGRSKAQWSRDPSAEARTFAKDGTLPSPKGPPLRNLIHNYHSASVASGSSDLFTTGPPLTHISSAVLGCDGAHHGQAPSLTQMAKGSLGMFGQIGNTASVPFEQVPKGLSGTSRPHQNSATLNNTQGNAPFQDVRTLRNIVSSSLHIPLKARMPTTTGGRSEELPGVQGVVQPSGAPRSVSPNPLSHLISRPPPPLDGVFSQEPQTPVLPRTRLRTAKSFQVSESSWPLGNSVFLMPSELPVTLVSTPVKTPCEPIPPSPTRWERNQVNATSQERSALKWSTNMNSMRNKTHTSMGLVNETLSPECRSL